MKITESKLRRIIRTVIAECYGWPVEKVEHIFGQRSKIDVQNPRDPKNPAIKMPKGPNSADVVALVVKEGFQRPTQRELAAWKEGDYGDLTEEVVQDPCDGCDKMFPSTALTKTEDGRYVCGSCAKSDD
jgi:hypothetical protein